MHQQCPHFEADDDFTSISRQTKGSKFFAANYSWILTFQPALTWEEYIYRKAINHEQSREYHNLTMAMQHKDHCVVVWFKKSHLPTLGFPKASKFISLKLLINSSIDKSTPINLMQVQIFFL